MTSRPATEATVTEGFFFDQLYAQKHHVLASPPYQMVRNQILSAIRARVPSLRDGVVLSIGCGDGGLEVALAEEAREFVATDISAEGIRLAARQAAARGSRAVFQVADALELPFQAERFDALLAVGVLHHLGESDRWTALGEVVRVLKPHGYFFSHDPSSRRFVALAKWLVHKKYEQYHSPDETELNPEATVELLSQAGLRVVDLSHCDFFACPCAWAFPAFPAGIFRAACAVDRLLVKLPGLRRWSSSFILTAQKQSHPSYTPGCPPK